MRFTHKPLATYTRISQNFSNKHKGVDFAAPKGTPIYAVADGTVYKAGNAVLDPSYGNQVVIQHSDAFTNYAHMSKINVKAGQKVKAGAKLGEVGATGNATGNHLHLELHTPKLWDRIDPLPYVNDTFDYDVGETYTTLVNLNVRTGAGTIYSKKTKAQLTADGQKHAMANGTLKVGTRVTCKEVKYVNSDIWIRIPSGWMAAYYKGKRYVG